MIDSIDAGRQFWLQNQQVYQPGEIFHMNTVSGLMWRRWHRLAIAQSLPEVSFGPVDASWTHYL